MRTYLPPRTVALIALACAIGASLGAWYLAGRTVDLEARSQLANRANLAAAVLERRIQRYIDLLYGLESLANHDQNFTRREFQTYVGGLDAGKRFPGLQAVQYLRRVLAREKEEYTRRVRSEGHPGFEIHPAGAREEYWVAEYIEPLRGNEAAFGLDIRMRPGAATAAQRALETGEPTMTGRYRLMQETGSSHGLVIYLPVFAHRPAKPADRRQAFRGFVNVVLRVDDFLGDTLAEPAFQGLRLQLHDLGPSDEAPRAIGTDSLFYPSGGPGWTPRYELDAPVAGRHWRLQFAADAPPSPWRQPLPLLVLGAGICISLLLYAIHRAIANTRTEAMAIADEATAALRTQLASRRQLEANLRESNERLRAVIQAAPLAIVARDRNSVIRMWNPAAERMFGWKEEEVLNTSTTIVPRDLAEESARVRRRAEAGETIWIEDTQRLHRDGRLVDVSITVAPIYDGEGRVSGTIVTVTDITRRKAAERALRESEQRLRLAMDAAQMGMWYWEVESDRFSYSEGLNAIFGRRADEPTVSYRQLRERLHPDDRELLAAAVRHAVKEGNDFQADCRVVWPDGSEHWIANRGQVHRGPDGRAERVIGVAMDITDRKLAEQRIAHMAHHDALTGLPNRVLLRDRIQLAIAQAHRSSTELAVLFIDLDRFKTINDSLGHQLGDRLLQAVASRILVCVREGDTVARVGGDEFVIVIPGLATAADASAVASKILEVLSTTFHLHGNDLHIAASIGISLYPADGADAETLMRNADTAMYHAKDAGRGRFQFFTQHMNVAAQRRLGLENALRRALENREFEVLYQPLYDLKDRSISGFEALLRWRPPGGDVVLPAQFISTAEECGLIVPIGEWTLREALRQAKGWQAPGRALRVSVNVSANQLSRSNFVDRLRRLIHETGIDPHLIELEVTESVIIEGAGDAREALDQIDALGVGIAIDDFGSGYSGLAYLKRLPIDTLKIDQSFVRDLTTDPDDAAIVTAIVAMAKSLGVEVVAEGVETEEQLARLIELGCHRAQGFLLASPMSGAGVARLLGIAEQGVTGQEVGQGVR